MNLNLSCQVISNTLANVPGGDVKLRDEDDKLLTHTHIEEIKKHRAFSCIEHLSKCEISFLIAQKRSTCNGCFCFKTWSQMV